MVTLFFLFKQKTAYERRISDWSSDVCSSDLHYHTDWVVPYWSSCLDKGTAVGTHLFFRWKGWWGTPVAFRSPGAETEPRIALIARLSAAHAESLPTDPAEPPLLAGGYLERSSGTDRQSTPLNSRHKSA